MKKLITFQEIIDKLDHYWRAQGCMIGTPYGLEVGAGTNNPYTFFGALGDKPISIAYLEPCRRPADARYAENPNRVGHYFQYQVILKPNPANNQELYLKSLDLLGISAKEHDIRFVEDNWEAPSFGASGLGWEVWLDGMEVTQYTYFQKMATIELKTIPVEITYGLERLAMYLQNKRNIFDIVWADGVTYGDVYKERERQGSAYTFDVSGKEDLQEMYREYEREAVRCLEQKLYYPAYDYLLKMSHTFNLMDARRMITQSQRVVFLGGIRGYAHQVAQLYLQSGK